MRRGLTVVLWLLLFSFLATACGASRNSAGADDPQPEPDPPPLRAEPLATADWLAVESWFYQLQRGSAQRIGDTAFDLVVVSISAAGNSPQTFPTLKESPGGRKIVLCYMSIGQAEEYRSYWQPEWEESPPNWLDLPDGNWQGDYWVKYWEPGWQEIIFGTPASYLDQLIALGCDGVYLDRVDAYVYYEDQGRDTAAREMADFVLALATYARERVAGFGVLPQNAEELGLQFPDYLANMTGIGVEDLYYGYARDHEASPAEWTKVREAALRAWRAADKLVLTVDYTSKPEQIADAYQRALDNDFVPYVGDRSLGRLRINPGFEPDRTPAEYDFSFPQGDP